MFTLPVTGEVQEDAGPQLLVTAGKAEFHCGEVVPLELAFTSATSDRYQINLATYDRSGRMSYEQFVLEPKQGTSDPLELYFNSAWGFLGGGLTGFKLLSTSATSIHLDLNEWVRFDRPGTYRLTVISRRVSDTHAANYPQNAGIKLESNPIELQITAADAAWQQSELKNILGALSRPGPPGGGAGCDPQQLARKALRYLGSEDAARELARRLGGEDNHADWDYMFGLIGSPHRDAGLKELNKLLGSPDFSVTDLSLTTMSMLPLDPKEPPGSLRKQRDENLMALRQRLASTLSNKRGKALAISLDTAMTPMGPGMPLELTDKLQPQLLEVFPGLPADKQLGWLDYRWRSVRDPKWLPVLRPLALHYEDFPELRIMPVYQSLQVSGAALKRWYELDPDGARAAVITEISRPKPRYNATVLGLLPDPTLPDVEHSIAAHFVETDDYEIEGNLASLLFRYADRAVLPEVLGKIESLVGKWACEPQDHALAYVLKVDPATAKPLIERALAARGPDSSACRHGVLTDIGVLQNDRILEQLAVNSLTDPDPEVASNAAGFLGRYGSADSERALWSRYEAWSREWRGRTEELRFIPTGTNPHVWDANLGQSLARALASGTNWFAGESVLRRIQSLGVGANIQTDVEQALQAWSRRPLTVAYMGGVPPTFTLVQYESLSLESLEKKLTQFPSGTRFAFPPSSPTPSPEEQKLREEVFDFAAKHRVIVMCAR
jgi:hypothetical protein